MGTQTKEKVMEKRILNVRPMFIFFVSLAFGVLFTYSLIKCIWKGSANFLVILSCLYLLCCLIFTVFSFVRPKREESGFIKFFFGICKYRLAIIGALVCFIIGAGCFFGVYSMYDRLEDFDEVPVTAFAKVVSVKINDKNSTYGLSDIVITDANGTRKLKSGGTLYIYSETSYSVGDCITFTAELNSADIKSGYSAFKSKSVYKFSSVENITVTGVRLTLSEKIRLRTWNNLSKNMNSQNAGIAYSVLFGDKSEIDPEIRSAFSYSGIAHVLAVSGLHVGFLIALISFVLKKLKVNKYANCGIIFAILLAYCWLCGFTPSVVRASIMAIILLVSQILGEEYDGLSSLSFAGIVIMLINPLNLFDIGFQLSFASVFGILTLTPTFQRLFTKWKFPKFLGDSLAISLATNIAIIAISLNYFSDFALLGIFTNLIVLPVFSITYSLLFVINIFALIIPALGMFLVLPDLLLHFIKIVANFVSGLPFGVVSVFHIGFIIMVLVLLVCYLSHYLMANKIVKRLIISTLTAIILISTMIINIPAKFNKNAVYITYQSNSNYALFVNDQDERVLVGIDDGSTSYLDNYLKGLKVNRLDCIVVYQTKLKDIEYINSVIAKYHVDTVVFATMKDGYKETLNSEVECKNIVIMDSNASLKLYGYDVNVFYYYGNPAGIMVSKGEQDVLLLKDRATRKCLLSLSVWWNKPLEYVIVNKSSVTDMEEILAPNNIYSYGYSKIESDIKMDIGYQTGFTLYL